MWAILGDTGGDRSGDRQKYQRGLNSLGTWCEGREKGSGVGGISAIIILTNAEVKLRLRMVLICMNE